MIARNKNTPSVFDELAEANPDALIPNGLDDAYIGYTVGINRPVAVYSVEECIECLCRREGITREEAEEYLDFNTFFAHFGPHSPIYVRLTEVRK